MTGRKKLLHCSKVAIFIGSIYYLHQLSLSFLTNISENKGIRLITKIFYNTKYLKFIFLSSVFISILP